MVLVGLLRGSFMFMADLCREVQVPHEVDFMTASSYGSGMSTTRDVKILKDLDEDIRVKTFDRGRHHRLRQYPV
ncbi:hypoxanthine-guanine phosphoribosyltransferase [Klebsiella pneumoniae]|uniref:Hypoxanthine-guanine phosphoribosyltransferase n=1 Tax=Klebsiella pneumoniae TaxID=573 RepID=A0A377ZJP6_KLEPN|nr:hypoxanthine-guanine phosphoribosyltransferase [Klebsiella pneumoniae]